METDLVARLKPNSDHSKLECRGAIHDGYAVLGVMIRREFLQTALTKRGRNALGPGRTFSRSFTVSPVHWFTFPERSTSATAATSSSS